VCSPISFAVRSRQIFDSCLGDRGSVTAEFACIIPALLLVLAFCLGGIQVVAQQIRLSDSAAAGARMLARGEDTSAAADRVGVVLGVGRLETEREGDFVCVTLSKPAAFGPVAAFGVTLVARNCALAGTN
jgi:hypothetical protein